jgi:RNA polymerase sigma-70 factor (sigma-E family)
MNRDDEAAYREYVAARLERLRRTAYLYCRDWHTADDLVGVTIGKLYDHWRRAQRADNLDAYVHGILTHAWLDERRRPWRREQAVAELPEYPAQSSAADGGDLLKLLASLPARRRACVVLRFYCDLSVEQTATVLGISAGTVKSQTARGLETLRALATHLIEERE